MSEKLIIENVKELIEIGNLSDSDRSKSNNNQRSYLMLYLHENTTLSLSAIAKMFNKKQHGTVSNAIRKAKKKIKDKDKKFDSDIAFLKHNLK